MEAFKGREDAENFPPRRDVKLGICDVQCDVTNPFDRQPLRVQCPRRSSCVAVVYFSAICSHHEHRETRDISRSSRVSKGYCEYQWKHSRIAETRLKRKGGKSDIRARDFIDIRYFCSIDECSPAFPGILKCRRVLANIEENIKNHKFIGDLNWKGR